MVHGGSALFLSLLTCSCLRCISLYCAAKRRRCAALCSAASARSSSLRPHGPQPASLVCPCGSPSKGGGLPCPPPGDLPNPGIVPRSPALQADSLPSEPPGKPKNTGVGSLSLLQGIFPTQESNWSLLHCRRILDQLSYQESPYSYILFHILFHYGLSQDIEHSFLCNYTVGPCCLSILYMLVCICYSQTPNLEGGCFYILPWDIKGEFPPSLSQGENLNCKQYFDRPFE